MTFAELADIITARAGAEIGHQIAQDICRQAAGEYVYIPAKHGAPEILPTDTPRSVQRRYGVSRSTAYSWVKRWRK